MSTFAAEDKPVIFWTPDYGAVIVRGAMNAAWDKLGGAKGDLGAPMADQTEDGDVITQRFSGGVVSWDSLDEQVHHRAGESGVPVVGSGGPRQERAEGAEQPAGIGHQRRQMVSSGTGGGCLPSFRC